MIQQEILVNKMNQIRWYLREVEPILQESTSTITTEMQKLRSVERLLQLIVDTAIDINTHIITHSDFSIPDDYESTFITLGEKKVLPMEFALKIAPSVGLRNRVVHKYGEINLKRMVDEIKENIDDYPEYLKHLEQFLARA